MTIPNPKLPILIIGAGVSGLTLAQGLRRSSVPFRLFERHPKTHQSQGHRFRIKKDSLNALNSVLLPEARDAFSRTAADAVRYEPRYVDARTFAFPKPVLVTDPRSFPVDRSWIRMVMTLGIEDAIEYGKEFARYVIDDDDVVQITFTDGSSARGCLLIGADGIRSRVRAQLQPQRRLLDLERWITWGRTPLTPALREQLPGNAVSWFMALDKDQNVQVIVEPMVWRRSTMQESGGKLPEFEDYLYYAMCTTPSGSRPKTAEERHGFIRGVAQDWHPALKLILDSASHDLSSCIPVLSSTPDIQIRESGQTGRVTLIGDAAHSMSPMGGSGGDTAVQNAVDLALVIRKEGVSEQSMRSFETRMEERAKEKIEHSFRGGQQFWNGKEWYAYQEIDI